MTENKGDLISREALKKAIDKEFEKADLSDYEACSCVCEIYDKCIDNAPTVEGEILTKEAYSDLCLRASQARPQGEITEEDIQNAIKAGYENGYSMAQAKYQRPQGKWIYNSYGNGCGNWHCSECGVIIVMCKNSYNNFCPNCGAEMVGGES